MLTTSERRRVAAHVAGHVLAIHMGGDAARSEHERLAEASR